MAYRQKILIRHQASSMPSILAMGSLPLNQFAVLFCRSYENRVSSLSFLVKTSVVIVVLFGRNSAYVFRLLTPRYVAGCVVNPMIPTNFEFSSSQGLSDGLAFFLSDSTITK